jgi:hypothetical protein
MYGALIASLGAVGLMLVADEAVARSGAVAGAAPRAAFASTRPMSRPSVAHSLRHHRRNFVGTFWPGIGDFSYGPSSGEPFVDTTPPTSPDVHYSYTYDVPWDWAHRYPPNVTPSDRPYVPSCGTESVTVPGRYGQDQTVNVMRCY